MQKTNSGAVRAALAMVLGLLATSALVLLPSAALAIQVVRVEVHPNPVTLAPEETQQFTATAVFDDVPPTRQDITAIAEWTVQTSKHGRFLHPGQPGLLTARDPGTMEVRAALIVPRGDGGTSKIKGNSMLTVDAGPIVGLSTSPSGSSLEFGTAVKIKARATYFDGYEGDVSSEVTFSVAPAGAAPGAATIVNAPGEATHGDLIMTSLGRIEITAIHTASGLSFSREHNIVAQVTSIEFDTLNYTMGRNMEIDLRLRGIRTDNSSTGVNKDAEWDITPPGIIEIVQTGDFPGANNIAGRVTALADGVVQVHATDTRRDLTTAAPVTITVSGLLTGLEVLANPFKVGAGEVDKGAKALGLLSSGAKTLDLRKGLQWTTGDDTIATVGAFDTENVGKVTGIQKGMTTLTATHAQTGISATIPLEVRGEVTHVSVEPGSITTAKNILIQLNAYAHRDDGSRSNVTNGAHWFLWPPGFVTVDKGVVTAIADTTSGPVTVSATDLVSGKSSSTSGLNALVTVAGNVVSIEVPDLKVDFADSRKAKVFGITDAPEPDNRTSDLRETSTFEILDTTIATVDDGSGGTQVGNVNGIQSGTTTLTATEMSTGISGTGRVRVEGAIVGVAVEPGNGGKVPVGSTVQYKARAALEDGGEKNITDRCDWTINDDSVARVANLGPTKGEVTGVTFGGVTTVRIDCPGDFSAQGIVEVIGSMQSLRVTPENFRGDAGRTKQYRAFGLFEGEFELDVTKDVLWSSSNEFVASVNNTDDPGQVRLLRDGVTTIFAVAETGHSATAFLEVEGGLQNIRITPKDKETRGSIHRKMKAIARFGDDTEKIVNQQVTWSTSDPTIARFKEGDFGVIIAGPNTGTATITASLEGVPDATTTITVTSLLTDLQMRRPERTLKLGRTLRVPIRGFFDNGTRAFMGRFVELRSSDSAVAEVSVGTGGRGRVTAVSPGIAVISAFDPTSGLTSTVDMTITVIE